MDTWGAGWGWMLTLLVGMATAVTGDIRCYCNDASCVRTGYMCKSALGHCFFQVTTGDTTRSRHGCADTLPRDDRHTCLSGRDVNTARVDGQQDTDWPILICCKEDLCNYLTVKDIDINLGNYKPSRTNETKDDGRVAEHSPEGVAPWGTPSQRELWFKAAVIAVPIAGGFILVLLVLLAVRVLKNDSRRHRQLMRIKKHNQSLTKAQLYVADHFCHDNGAAMLAERCLHSSGGGGSAISHAPVHSHPPRGKYTPPGHHSHPHPHHSNPGSNRSSGVPSVSKSSNIYRDVHIKVDHNKNGYEKIRPVSDGSSHEGACGSVVIWAGRRKSTDHPAEV